MNLRHLLILLASKDALGGAFSERLGDPVSDPP
jgi:hypothetical protein